LGLAHFGQGLGNSPLILARFLASAPSGHADFQETLRRVLYRKFRYDAGDPNLRAIVSFLAEGLRRGGDNMVLTYNFDDLLEQAITSYPVKIPFRTMGPDERIEETKALAIVHRHGCIPRNGAVGGTQVVFDEIQYNRQYNSRMNTIDVIQSYCFSQMVCLFLGTSLVDPNTRRLLDAARFPYAGPPRRRKRGGSKSRRQRLALGLRQERRGGEAD
jgi:SIR2-like domain